MSAMTADWESTKQTLPVGTRLRGRVSRHWPFGIFVDIPSIPFQGLVQITEFKDTGKMTPAEYPALGCEVDVVVLGFKESGRQIWLGMKPSRLCQSKRSTGND